MKKLSGIPLLLDSTCSLISLVNLLIISCSFVVGEDKIESVQSPEDCGIEQFYYPVKSSCRNCTDIIQTFHSYQDWLGREVSDLRRNPNKDNNNNNLGEQDTDLSPSSNGGRLRQTGPGGARFTGDGGEILSRLISVDPQDQEYLDSNQDLMSNSGVGGGANNIDLNGDSLLTNGNGDSATMVGQTTRQFKSIVDRFVQSKFIGNELLGAIEQCRQYQNISACQMWSNMCVLTMYSYSDSSLLASSSSSSSSSTSSSSTSSPTLSAYYQNNNNNNNRAYKSGSRRQQQKRPIRTWQMCRQFNANSICNSLRDWFRIERKPNFDILNIYAADEPLLAKISHTMLRLNQVIQLLVYKYSYDGKFIGVSQFGLEELERFCIVGSNIKSPHLTMKDTNHVRLGKNMRFKCQFNPLQALRSPTRIKHFNETIFMDLYIVYPLNGAMFVKPVPIMIKNILYNGIQINRRHQKDSSRWKLVHRFFFHTILDLDQPLPYTVVESVDGVGDKLTPTNEQVINNRRLMATAYSQGADSEKILLYTKSVLLDLKFRRQEKGALLTSLLLTLDYGHLSLQDYETMMFDSNNSSLVNGNNNNATSMPPNTQLPTNSRLTHNLESDIEIIQTLTDMSSYKKDLDLTMTILGILSSIWALIRCYNMQKCYGIVKLDLETLIRFLLVGCDIVANLFAAITLIFMAYLFLALKCQSTIQVLVPTDDLENALVVNLQLAFLFKLIGLAHKLYVMLNVDIFFIDWEKPKMLTSAEILNHKSHYYNNHHNGGSKGSNHDGLKSSSTTIIDNNINNDNLDNNLKWLLPSNQQSSFWRPYTIINRWLQMQTLRLHNTSLQLLLFVCIVNFSQVINLATSDPSLDLGAGGNCVVTWTNNNEASSNGDGNSCSAQQTTHLTPYISTTFRLLILSIVYMCLSMSQILYKKYFYEPMIRNRVHEFVDLCSVANVSLFCMLYPRFGYYIHGRNANGSGDCGIGEMNALLEREERDLCSKRGLAPNSDQQTFVLILPKIINDHYRKLLFRDYDHLLLGGGGGGESSNKHQSLNVSRLNNTGNQTNKFMGTSNSLIRSALNLSIAGGTSSRSFSSNRTMIETMVAKNKTINLFLTNFLEHIYKDIDYSIRDRRRFESLLLGVDFDDENLITTTNRNLGPLSMASNGGNSNGGLTGISTLNNSDSSGNSSNLNTAATFCKDPTYSFTSLLWLGLEFDLVFVELFTLLILDLWLRQPLAITSSLVFLLHHSFKASYVAFAKRNLIAKALVDEKFLFR